MYVENIISSSLDNDMKTPKKKQWHYIVFLRLKSQKWGYFVSFVLNEDARDTRI